MTECLKLAESFTTQFDPFVQTIMLTPGSMENGQKDIEELPTRKMYLKLRTIFVQICLILTIFMVPSDQKSQNVGSENPKSNYLRKIYYKDKQKI